MHKRVVKIVLFQRKSCGDQCVRVISGKIAKEGKMEYAGIFIALDSFRLALERCFSALFSVCRACCKAVDRNAKLWQLTSQYHLSVCDAFWGTKEVLHSR